MANIPLYPVEIVRAWKVSESGPLKHRHYVIHRTMHNRDDAIAAAKLLNLLDADNFSTPPSPEPSK